MKTDGEIPAKTLYGEADQRVLLAAITLLALERATVHELLLPGMDYAIHVLKEFRNARKQ